MAAEEPPRVVIEDNREVTYCGETGFYTAVCYCHVCDEKFLAKVHERLTVFAAQEALLQVLSDRSVHCLSCKGGRFIKAARG